MADYIDRDKLDISGKGFKNYDDYSHYIDLINEQPSVDAVEVVRCKDCKHRDKTTQYCEMFERYAADDFFCKKGEKE